MLLSMQIAASCKDFTSNNQCSSSKENDSLDVKSNGKCKSTWPNRHRAFSKLRHKKSKRQNTYGNQHRLDHTYAASANFISIPQTNGAEHSDDCVIIEDEVGSHNWLPNSRLEMHENGIKLSIQDSCAGSGDVASEKSACLQVTGANGALKQYSRSRKISKDKIRLSSPTLLGKPKVGKTIQEDKKRLIAALALIQLAQSS